MLAPHPQSIPQLPPAPRPDRPPPTPTPRAGQVADRRATLLACSRPCRAQCGGLGPSGCSRRRPACTALDTPTTDPARASSSGHPTAGVSGWTTGSLPRQQQGLRALTGPWLPVALAGSPEGEAAGEGTAVRGLNGSLPLDGSPGKRVCGAAAAGTPGRAEQPGIPEPKRWEPEARSLAPKGCPTGRAHQQRRRKAKGTGLCLGPSSRRVPQPFTHCPAGGQASEQGLRAPGTLTEEGRVGVQPHRAQHRLPPGSAPRAHPGPGGAHADQSWA